MRPFTSSRPDGVPRVPWGFPVTPQTFLTRIHRRRTPSRWDSFRPTRSLDIGQRRDERENKRSSVLLGRVHDKSRYGVPIYVVVPGTRKVDGKWE